MIMNNSMTIRMPCTEWHRLLDLYVVSSARHLKCLADLSRSAVSDRAHRFDREWEECEVASAISSNIKKQMYEHLRQHECALTIKAVSILERSLKA
jgi:hypothetical protein